MSFKTKGIVQTSKDYPMNNDSTVTRLPSTVKKLYGCSYCEWKDKLLCPFGYRKGKGFKESSNRHSNGICQERINYLLSFYRGRSLQPSFTSWQHDYNRGIAQLKLRSDYSDLEVLESDLKLLVDDLDVTSRVEKDKYRFLSDRVAQKRDDWNKLWKQITDLDDKDISRNTVKKVEIDDKKTISVSDWSRLVRSADSGTVIDADYDVIEGLDED